MIDDIYHQMCHSNMTEAQRNKIIEDYDKYILARIKHHDKCCRPIDQQHCAVFQRFNYLAEKCKNQNNRSYRQNQSQNSESDLKLTSLSPPPPHLLLTSYKISPTRIRRTISILL
jgi:hypothetical protein